MPEIISRSDWQTEYNPTEPPWNASRRQPFTVVPAKRKGLVVHCNGPNMDYTTEAAERRAALAVARYHWQTLGWSDGAYSWLIGNVTGNAYTLRGLMWDQFANGDDEIGVDDGADTEWYTAMWMGGNYQAVSDAAIDGFDMILTLIRDAGAGSRVLPHNDFKAKPCPGPTLTGYARIRDNEEPNMPVPFEDDWWQYFNDAPHNGQPDFIVAEVESRLKQLGYLIGADGVKSDNTLAAVQKFKADEFGADDPNARIGPRAWNRLRELTAVHAAPAAGMTTEQKAGLVAAADEASIAIDKIRFIAGTP